MNSRQWEKKINIDCFGVMVLLLLFSFIIAFNNEPFANGFLFVLKWGGSDTCKILENMRVNAEFIGNTVWTLTTILASFIAFYYSSVKYKNYGISNRKIMSFTYGTIFLPLLVLENSFVVFLMTISFYVQAYASFYIFAFLSGMLQVWEMYVCIKVTSQKKCFETIIRIEREQFDSVYNNFENIRLETLYPEIWFMGSILEGDEEWIEKAEITHELLLIPVVKNANGMSYRFWFENMRRFALYSQQNPQFRQKTYNLFYENFDMLGKKSHQNTDLKLTYLGAVFRAFIPMKELDERWNFFANLIRKKENESIASQMVLELLACTVYMESIDKLNFNNREERARIEECFGTLKGYWKENSIDVLQLRSFLEMWLQNTNSDKGNVFRQIYRLEKEIVHSNDGFVHYLLKCILGGTL